MNKTKWRELYIKVGDEILGGDITGKNCEKIVDLIDSELQQQRSKTEKRIIVNNKEWKRLRKKWWSRVTYLGKTTHGLDEPLDCVFGGAVPWGDDSWSEYLTLDALEFIKDFIAYKLLDQSKRLMEGKNERTTTLIRNS